jgi:hypothetical protein
MSHLNFWCTNAFIFEVNSCSLLNFTKQLEIDKFTSEKLAN